MPGRATTLAVRLAPPVILVGLSVALFAYLLARFPYNGLYGQDAYAYFYQAEALWREMTGQPHPPFALFTADGLYWPVGYHLHLLPGFLAGWPEAGRVLTLLLAALTPAVLYLVVGELWHSARAVERRSAGLVAGVVLLLNGTYTRTALSLMSDVPALFWGMLAVYCCLKAWPPREQAGGGRRNDLWALGAGLSLGVAVLVRYSSALLVPALVVYLLARAYGHRKQRAARNVGEHGAPQHWMLLYAAIGVAVALLPQVAYTLTHEPGPALRAWSLENIFSNVVSGPDGTATFSQPMIVFYLLSPIANANAGFFSPFYLPALAYGVWVLVRQRSTTSLLLLFSWWLIAILAYSGTPYQAHRFALTYMPVLALLTGVGASAAFFRPRVMAGKTQERPAITRAIRGFVAALALLGIVTGLAQCWRSVEQWAATHSTFNAQEQQVVTLARQAAAASGREGTPKVVCFGFSAPLYHYTRWPTLDFFAHDEAEIRVFLATPGPRLLVLPEESMSTQWAGTPSGARWQWIQSTYNLTRQGRVGAFTVYIIRRP